MTEGRSIARHVSVDITPTIDELGKMIAHMSDEEQARLLSSIAEHSAGFPVPMQLQYVTDCPSLTLEGRALMQLLGDYASPTS